MARNATVSILIKAKDLSAAALGRAQRGIKGLVSSVFSLKGALVGLAGFAGFRILRGLANMWAEQESAIIRLNAVLRSTGRFSEEASDGIQKMASEMQRLTIHGDEALILATATLGQFADELTGPQLAEAQKVLIGLADTLGLDLQSAALTLGKSLSGEINLLGRYGISIDTTRDQQGRFNEVLQKTASFFQVSKEATNSVKGASAQLGNAYGDVREQLGRVVVESLTAQEGMSSLTDTLLDATDNIDKNIGTWIKWGRIVVQVIKLAGSAFVTGLRVIKNAFEIAAQTWGLIFLSFFLGVQVTFNRVADLANTFIEGVNKLPGIEIDFRFGEMDVEATGRAITGLKEGIREDMDDIVDASNNTAAHLESLMSLIRGGPVAPRAIGSGPAPPPSEDGGGGEESDAQKKQREILTALGQQLVTIEEQERLLGDRFDETAEKANAFRAALEALTQAGADQETVFEGEFGSLAALRDEYVRFQEQVDEAARRSEAQKQAEQDRLEALREKQMLFADATDQLFQGLINSNQNFGEAFLATTASVLSEWARGEARGQIAEGVKDLATGAWPPNPAALEAASMHFAAAGLFFGLAGAAGGVGRGGGVGGGGPRLEADRRTRELGDLSQGEATWIIEGSGVYDMNDPRVRREVQGMFEELSGRRVNVKFRG